MVMRMPLRAYRHDAGWLLGRVFLEFTHLGRRTGQPHDAVAMVLDEDDVSREVVFCAAWGPDTDWFKNLLAHPATKVRVGHETYVPEQRFLAESEACEAARRFRAAHPYRLRLMSWIMGWGDLTDDENVRAFVGTHPFIAFRPAEAKRSAA
jgi:deazaflavin-dependent oxidoreductase (nitroreductase family)